MIPHIHALNHQTTNRRLMATNINGYYNDHILVAWKRKSNSRPV